MEYLGSRDTVVALFRRLPHTHTHDISKKMTTLDYHQQEQLLDVAEKRHDDDRDVDQVVVPQSTNGRRKEKQLLLIVVVAVVVLSFILLSMRLPSFRVRACIRLGIGC